MNTQIEAIIRQQIQEDKPKEQSKPNLSWWEKNKNYLPLFAVTAGTAIYTYFTRPRNTTP